MERFSYPGDTPQLLSVPYHGTKRCLYLHQWMNATTRLKSSMKRFDNFKWCSTKQLKVSQLRLTFFCFSAPAALLRSCLVLSGALPLMYPAALCPLRLRSAQTGTGGRLGKKEECRYIYTVKSQFASISKI